MTVVTDNDDNDDDDDFGRGRSVIGDYATAGVDVSSFPRGPRVRDRPNSLLSR